MFNLNFPDLYKASDPMIQIAESVKNWENNADRMILCNALEDIQLL